RANGPDDRRDERGRHGDRSRQRTRPRVSRRARPRQRGVGGGGRRSTPRRGGEDAVAVVTADETAKRAYDAKTKPRGSLGRLEELGCRLAAIRGFVPRTLDAAIVVAAADHGVAREGVSAYPQEVTAQMVANFVAGGAAVNVLARQAGARLILVDAGVAAPFEHEGVRALRLGAGTASLADGPAMTAEQVQRGLDAGRALADELREVDVVALGDMGIGNTTSASALTAALLGVDAARVCGRGTGLDDAGVAHKVETVRRALEVNRGNDPLTALGGFEIVFLA